MDMHRWEGDAVLYKMQAFEAVFPQANYASEAAWDQTPRMVVRRYSLTL